MMLKVRLDGEALTSWAVIGWRSFVDQGRQARPSSQVRDFLRNLSTRGKCYSFIVAPSKSRCHWLSVVVAATLGHVIVTYWSCVHQ